MKKLLVFLTVCTMLTSCASAGKKADPNQPPVTTESSVSEEVNYTESAEPVYTDCYQAEKLAFPEHSLFTRNMTLAGDSIILETISDSHGENLFYQTDKSFSHYEIFGWEHTEEEETADFSSSYPYFKADGSFNAMVELQDHNGIKFPEEYDDNFDYSNYFNPDSYTVEKMFCTYDNNGKVLTKAIYELPEGFTDEDGYSMISGIIADSDSMLMATYQNGIYRLDATGNFTEIRPNGDYNDDFNSLNFITDNNGKILCIMYSYDGEYLKASVYEINGNNISAEPVYTFNANTMINTSRGIGKYRFFVSTHDSLMGFTEDGISESVINWLDSDTEPMQTIAIGENEFIGTTNDCYMRLTPRDMREFASVKTLTFASPISDDYQVQNYQNIINDFNRSQSNYRIKTVTVADNIEDYKNALNMMILKGEAPDIIYGIDYDDYVNYRSKGLFENLYNLIDEDATLSRADFMPNVMPLLESADGSLYGVCDSFYVQTLFTKSSLWSKENWTLDEMIDLYDNIPDTYTHIYDDVCRADMLKTMLNCMTDMVDYENGTCNFNNPDFMKILEFCSRHVVEEPIPDKVDEMEAFENYYGTKYQRFGNDEIIFISNNVFQYNFIKYLQCMGNDITMAGYPSNDGNGGIIIPNSLMCINGQCENKQGAWEFLKYVMNNTRGLSIITEQFEKVMDNELTNSWSASGNEIPAFDKATRDKVADYVKSCHKLGARFGDYYVMPFNKDIFSIIEEETDIYFNGEQTVESCVEHIQDRVSVLVSERN